MEPVSSGTLAPSMVAFIQQAVTSPPAILQHMVAILATEAILDIDSKAMDLPLVVRSSTWRAVLLLLIGFWIRWSTLAEQSCWFFGLELYRSFELISAGQGRWEFSFGVICPMLGLGL